MTDVIADLSNLTTIPTLSLEKLRDKINYIICHSVQEAILEQGQIAETDIGIGILYIKFDEGTVKFKFVPSAALNKAVCSTVQNRQSPLTAQIEEALRTRVTETYKNFF